MSVLRAGLALGSYTRAGVSRHPQGSDSRATITRGYGDIEEEMMSDWGSEGKTAVSTRVGVMALIFGVSLFAASFPTLSRKMGSRRPPQILFFIGKHFGSGVILATAFVHLLQDAFESLLDPQVKAITNIGRWTGLIAYAQPSPSRSLSIMLKPPFSSMGSLLVIFFIEYLSTSYVDHLQSYPSAPPSPKIEPITGPAGPMSAVDPAQVAVVPLSPSLHSSTPLPPSENTPLLSSSSEPASPRAECTALPISTSSHQVRSCHCRGPTSYIGGLFSGHHRHESRAIHEEHHGQPPRGSAILLSGEDAEAALEGVRHSHRKSGHEHEHEHEHEHGHEGNGVVHRHAHGHADLETLAGSEVSEEEVVAIGRKRQIVGILVLQLGIMIHSLVIGLTLSIASGSDFSEGNVVSIEFNLLYRWHATVSQEDTAWTEKIFTELFQGKDYRTITVDQFAQAVRQAVRPSPDIKQWTFDGLKRDDAGRFSDADIARILQSATESSSSAFKARGTPEVLRVIELLSIEQARTWGTCSLNEFRSFLGLKPYANFKEWNPDPEIYNAAEALYHDIDNLELHVGLQAEEAKVPMPGAGLCPGYTISRAILADAVCLTRGDRFLTVDFTPFNLTNWGYQDCQVDDSDGSYGGMLTKLLYRHLPDYYPARSTYAHFPFIVPKTMKEYAAKLPDDALNSYTWTKPLPPPGPLVVAKTYADVKRGITINPALVEKLLFAESQIDRAVKSMSDITSKLISTKAIKAVGSGTKYVDIVRDVLNLLPVHWLSNDIVGLSIKSEENPHGIFRDHQLTAMFKDISDYVYFNQVPAHDWTLRTHGRKAADEILDSVRSHLAKLHRGKIAGKLRDAIDHRIWDGNDHSDAFLSALDATVDSDSDSALDSLVASLFAEVVPTAALFSKALVHVVNYYLDPSRQSEKEQLQRLTAEGSNPQVLAMVYEALRLDPPISSVRRTAISATTLAGSPVEKGQVVLASLIDANQDSSVFPPTDSLRPSIDLNRLGIGHRLLSLVRYPRIILVRLHICIRHPLTRVRYPLICVSHPSSPAHHPIVISRSHLYDLTSSLYITSLLLRPSHSALLLLVLFLRHARGPSMVLLSGTICLFGPPCPVLIRTASLVPVLSSLHG
ncbi:hypothetical protein EVG20_g9464 [Dentipellis fragilis]|uniref:Uncharacterized protein n=1 Tax=Dentipellis fragilis TaxID=205917 RepID=A0A4Y9XXR4_9AGAM|nr:hypothetical protein EVG20_g9464 [Dentipellis fragilis]